MISDLIGRGLSDSPKPDKGPFRSLTAHSGTYRQDRGSGGRGILDSLKLNAHVGFKIDKLTEKNIFLAKTFSFRF